MRNCEDAWLLMRLRNIAVALSEKESICKYYFVDNGVLDCKRRTIFTFDEESTFTDEFGTIEVIPVWKYIILTPGK